MKIYTTEEFMKKDLHVHVFKCDISDISDAVGIEETHSHEFIEIVYILSGRMSHVINSREYQVKQGDVLFMTPGCTHSFSSEEKCAYVNILFAPERISLDLLTPSNSLSLMFLTAFDDITKDSGFGKLSFLGMDKKEAENIVLAMEREYRCKQSSWERVLENYLNTLIVKMLRKVELGISPLELNDVWKKLSQYIDSNLDTKLTADALARKFFYNPSYFSRIFKEKFGMPFVEYLSRKRLNQAIELLKNTDLSINEISVQAGFSDSKSLYRAFSAYLNTTPSRYRKQKR